MHAVPFSAAAAAAAGTRALRPALLAAAALAFAGDARCASQADDALAALANQTTVQRTVALSDLGISAPIVLKAGDRHRDLYLPVPPGIPIRDASLRLDADYLLPEAAATSLVLSLDNDAVSARAFAGDKGDAGAELGVDGSARASGFVHLGVKWTSAPAGARCPARRAAHNALRIHPATRLSYRYDSAEIRDLASAWNALPPAPVILVAGRALTAPSYDSAWRIGAALARAGRRPAVRALPQPGDQVDLSGIDVPAGLRAIPAFDALAQGGRHKIADAAEVGALLALGAAGPLQADLLLLDPALHTRLGAAVQALRAQAAAAGAGAAFVQWEQRNRGALGPARPREVRLATLAGRPAIVLGAGAGVRAAALFDEARRQPSLPGRPRVAALPVVDLNAPEVALPVAQLGAYVGSFEAGDHAEWQFGFDLDGGGHGRTPTQAVIDVAAAPHPQGQRLTASVLLNDILLGSQRLDDDGSAQRLAVAIPRYVALPNNSLRVVFQRPASDDDCPGKDHGAPLTVLPTSHIVFEHREPAADFVGMRSRFATDASLILPPAYLADAPASLAQVIYISAALGVPPAHAHMQVADGVRLHPPGPFLSFEPPGESLAEGARPLLAARRAVAPGAPAEAGYGMLKLTRADGYPGIVFSRLGAHAPRLSRPFVLGHSEMALLGADEVVAELDADGFAWSRMQAEGPSVLWRGAIWWLLPCTCVLLFIGLLVVASHVRRRKERAAALQKEAG